MDYIHKIDDNTTVTETLGFATHLYGGEVSLFSISRRQNNGPSLLDVRLIDVIHGVIEGASGLATNPNPDKQDIYVTGRRDPNPHVAVLQVHTKGDGSYLENPWFSQAKTIKLSTITSGGTDARGIAVSPDGFEGFMLTQTPPALIKLDLKKYEAVATTTVCKSPSKVKTFLDKKDINDPTDDALYAFVLCFLTGDMYIVNTKSMQTLVRATGAGPQDIAFDFKRKLAYVANFKESTISIFQAVPPFNQLRIKDPDNPSDLKVIRIGEPK
jgi:DNA-binding beta-propeller fold protein YncE